MKLFLDTSSLFKLYHQEADSHIIESIFANQVITAVYLSELTKIEFTSTLWRKVRMQEITEAQAKTIIVLFENDFNRYLFVPIDTHLIEKATILLTKYGSQGLRTLDSIQLATAISIKPNADLFLTADKILDSFFNQETLQTKL